MKSVDGRKNMVGVQPSIKFFLTLKQKLDIFPWYEIRFRLVLFFAFCLQPRLEKIGFIYGEAWKFEELKRKIIQNFAMHAKLQRENVRGNGMQTGRM